MNQNVKVVVLGGGTGSFMLLEELKNHTKDIESERSGFAVSKG